MTKPEARARVKCLRRTLDQAALGSAMAEHLFAAPVWQNARTVFCFVPLRDEPDTMPVLCRALAEHRRLAVPRVTGEGTMELVALAGLEDLRPRAYGILEPDGGTVLTSLGPDALALIPCLAADRNGVRLGRGGGYYDRFLGQYKGEKRLLCPEALLFDALPADPWDVIFRPDEILTEKGFLR